jgi:hypothetical protein
MAPPSNTLLALLVVLCISASSTNAFYVPRSAGAGLDMASQQMRTFKPTFGPVASSLKAKKKEDLSYIESRDMTKAEMLEYNKKSEDIMNMELSMMTGFSLVISLPILYLCWVAFFSE